MGRALGIAAVTPGACRLLADCQEMLRTGVHPVLPRLAEVRRVGAALAARLPRIVAEVRQGAEHRAPAGRGRP